MTHTIEPLMHHRLTPADRAHPRRHAALIPALTLLFLGACGNDGGEAAPVGDAAQQAPQENQVVDLASLGFDEGDESTALFGVVEFSDFGCIFCAGFHIDSYPTLHDEFVASGEILWKYIPITIGGFPNGRLAGLSGICAGRLGHFAEMRDLLFEEREAWLAADEDPDLFVGYAESVGVEEAPFRSCLDGEEAAHELDEADRVAVQIGVSGTPTFIVRGIPVRGAPPLDSFRDALNQMLDEARGITPPTPSDPN